MAPKNKINLKDRLENGELDLSMTDLQEVPVKEIAAVKKATSLDLSNNRLTTLGKNFITLTHIIKLDLSKNQLTELPEDFGEMRQLKHLDLYSNQITHLPLSFCELKSLRWLDLKNNPLVPAVAKVVGPCLDAQQCQQSARATVAFLTELSANVEEERERLRQQELKQLEAQQDKERQQRKRNERKKAAKAKKKEMKKEMEKEEVLMENAPKHETEQTNGVNWKVPKDNDQKLKKQAKTKSRLSFLSFLFLCIPSLAILAFLISASGILGPTGDLWREHLTNQSSQLLEKLPVSARPWGDKLTVLISNLHGSTSILINNICDVVVDFSQSEQVSTSLEFLAQTFSVVSNHSVEMFRTMKEKVLFITEEITKKII